MASLPMEAPGIEHPEGGAVPGPGGGTRQSNVLLGYLVEFLTERAAG
jgi:hypothetical protein